jgi:Uma2 family endonuclease
MLPTMFDPDSLAPEAIRKLSRREYEKLVELGVFEDERIELLRGMLVTMSPQGVEHSGITAWFLQQLIAALGVTDWDVRGHSPYVASDDSEPEPDISVSRKGSNMLVHPSASVLLIEVSDSSIKKDRRIKAPIYAEANVPEYWIVDISSDELRIEVHTEPTPSGYRRVEILRDGDVLRPARLPDLEIAVTDIPWKR